MQVRCRVVVKKNLKILPDPEPPDSVWQKKRVKKRGGGEMMFWSEMAIFCRR